MNIFPQKIHVVTALAFIIILLAAVLCFSEKESFTINRKVLDTIERKYGHDSRLRLLEWENFIRGDRSSDPLDKLQKVNVFFNKMNFVSDFNHWGTFDYWATPIEFLASKGGDCEDFSIAKYFTLRALGVPDEKLLLTYVKALRLNQAHMVLAYYSQPDADPLILDNLTEKIAPGSERRDLLPVYSFNASSLWIAKQRGKGEFVGNSDRLRRWRELLKRMEDSN